MPVITAHSPADIIRHVLIALVVGTDPDDGAAWPVFCGDEPDVPDNCVTVYDTEGRDFGRVQVSGERQEFYGVQVRVRGETYPIAAARTYLITEAVDTDAYMEVVTLDGTHYCVHSINRPAPPISLGRQAPESNRTLFVLNALAVIVKLTDLT